MAGKFNIHTRPYLDLVDSRNTPSAPSLDDLDKLLSGTLDPTLAYMIGKLKTQSSTGVAMTYAAMLGNWRAAGT